MEYLIYIGCFLLGGIVAWLIKRPGVGKPDALLNVDVRDEEKDYYDFVFLIPTDDIPKKKNIMVEIHVKE